MSARGLVVLDLCGGSGAWAKPYDDAGYDVRRVTLPDQDVRLYAPPKHVHGILAAPPCTYFCRMRMCRGEPSSAEFIEGLSTVDACLRIVLVSKPKWWALENPQGYLNRWLGEPQFKFDPCEYGDPWTKRTWLWGSFVPPNKRRVVADGPLIRRKAGKRGVAVNDSENAVTPAGFACAFMEANP